MEPKSPKRYAEIKDSLDRIRRALEGSLKADTGLAHLRWVEAQVELLRCVFDEMEAGCPQEPLAGAATNRLQSAIPRKGK